LPHPPSPPRSSDSGDLAEVYRRLAYNLDRFWKANDMAIVALTRSYSLAAGALVIETLSLVVLLVGSIV
jgi:hypothetical protein